MPSTDLGAETIAEMEIHGIFPYQMAIEAHAGSRLQNAAVLRIERLRPSQKHVPHKGATRRILAPGRDDTIELGVTALLAHCRRLLHEGPLEIIQEYDRTTIRVLGVLDYVVDKANSRIFVRSAGVASRLSINELGLIEPIDSALVYENIELLAPLCTPCWLRYVAYGAGGICDHSTDEDLFQFPLWANNPHAAQLLNVICDRVFRRLRASRDFRRLRSTLSFWLLQAIGADTVDLALRARTVFKRKGLLAADVNLVWKYCRLYQRMDRENPRLLPVLSAWLRYRGFAVSRGLDDAVPSMRQDLLAKGLPPRAWRYLLTHGPRALVFRADCVLTWGDLLSVLRQLCKARWPAPPPRGFLSLLGDAAGVSESYLEPGDGVPGWFWQWACQQARASARDARRYSRLRDQLVQWAWLVRKYQPRPDSNQRRSCHQWLQKWAEQQEAITTLSTEDSWGLWLRHMPWERIERLRVVPLLSPCALRQEGLAMHNCADQFLQSCLNGDCLLLSLRRPDSDKRVALMSLTRHDPQSAWKLQELSGPCNRPVPAWVEPIAAAVAAMVCQGEQAWLATRALLRSISAQTSADK